MPNDHKPRDYARDPEFVAVELRDGRCAVARVLGRNPEGGITHVGLLPAHPQAKFTEVGAWGVSRAWSLDGFHQVMLRRHMERKSEKNPSTLKTTPWDVAGVEVDGDGVRVRLERVVRVSARRLEAVA